MDETKAIELLKNWDEIISPQDCDDLLFWLSSWITEKEQELTEQDATIAQRKLKLLEEKGSVPKATVQLETEEIFYKARVMKNKLNSLKSARSNVKRRYEILTNKLLQNRRY